MSKLKNAFYHSICFRADIDEQMHEDRTIDVELAEEMLTVIDKLEYELALYHAGCPKEEVDSLMKKTYKSVSERIGAAR